MRVGVVFDQFPPESGGGHTFQQELLTRIVSRTGSRHDLLPVLAEATASRDDQGNVIRYATSRIKRLRESFLPADLPWSRRSQFDVLCRRERLDCLWFTFPFLNERPPDAPFIATVWDLHHRLSPWFPEVSARGEWDRRERLMARMLRRATFVIASNEAGRDEVGSLYQVPSGRVVGIPHPTPDWALRESFEDSSSILKKFDLPGRFILYPARFWAHKNHANLLRALERLKVHHKLDLTLVLTGEDAGNRAYIEALAREMDLPGVRFLGHVEQRELGHLYRSARALVYLTLFGPENLPPLEAMALRCPVVASNVEGASDQLGEAAILVDPLDPTEIAQAIRRVVEDEETRGRLITLGRERAEQWTVEGFLGSVEDLLDRFEPIRRTWPHSGQVR